MTDCTYILGTHQVKVQTPCELLHTFLPANLKLTAKTDDDLKLGSNAATVAPHQGVTKNLFSAAPRGDGASWMAKEEEEEVVKKFLAENSGKTIWHLMRAFLDFMFRYVCLI